jgi:hypothetical protein
MHNGQMLRQPKQRKMTRNKLTRYLLSFFVVLVLYFPVSAQECVLFITSNLEGRFSLQKSGSDPMMLLLQSLYHEREKKNPVFFIDMGNVFHPGPLSRFSYGSVVHDYLDFNGCEASLISSNDLRVGIDSLLQLDGSGRKLLLSANIRREGKQLFKPYTVLSLGDKKIILVGLSNDSAIIDIAEKNLYTLTIEPYVVVLKNTLLEISKNEKNAKIIVLSGLSTEKNVSLLKQFPSVSLVIAGGDSRGELFGSYASQIQFPDGRKILMADTRKGYYKAECMVKDTIQVTSFSYVEPQSYPVANERYKQFEKRLSLWKDRYKSEESRVFDKRRPFKATITPEKMAHLMRDAFRTEIGIVKSNAVIPFDLSENATNFEITRDIADDYFIYTFRMKGEDLSSIADDNDRVIKGLQDEKIQGRRILRHREYTVSSTQSVYEDLLKKGKVIPDFSNQWLSMADLVIKDVGGKAVLRRPDYSYLDSRFTLLCNISLKNMLSSENVTSGDTISTPVGMSSDSSTKWGIDDALTLDIFNSMHRFILNPSICYSEEQKKHEEKTYPDNVMKGIFTYQINMSDVVQPYHKSQYESMVRKIEDIRSAVLRETVGIDIESRYFTSKVGFGFEKKYHAEIQAPAYGIECTAAIQYPFFKGFKYKAAFDSFFSRGKDVTQNYYHFNVSNGISYEINSYLSFGMQHKYYKYFEKITDEKYSSRIFTFSLDLNTDVKVF